ncbi:unnamed protein product [Amoebophrya sp. A120]|nr:unnamed protein product [Amoebophrya sp. A120]|eukprot:GSA120T00019800001.1
MSSIFHLTLVASASVVVGVQELALDAKDVASPAPALPPPKCWQGRPFPYDSADNVQFQKQNVKTLLPYQRLQEDLTLLSETNQFLLPSEFSWREVEWSHVLKTSTREKHDTLQGKEEKAGERANIEEMKEQNQENAEDAAKAEAAAAAGSSNGDGGSGPQNNKNLLLKAKAATAASTTSASALLQEELLFQNGENDNRVDNFNRFDKILPRVVGNITKHVEHYLAPAKFSQKISMLTPIWNQHIPRYCGACWLHAGIAVMNDRLKIARKGVGEDIILSRQVVLNCGKETAGSCQGGSDVTLFDYVMKNGIPDESCQVYEARDYECSDFRTCMNCDPSVAGRNGIVSDTGCYAVRRFGKYFVEEYGLLDVNQIKKELEQLPSNSATQTHIQSSIATVPSTLFQTVRQTPIPPTHLEMIHRMKAEIFLRGPVTCSVDSDVMLKFPRGHVLLAQENRDWEFDHLIGVVGWGMVNKVPTWPIAKQVQSGALPFWLVRNSWGTAWGDNGWIRVAMGANVTGIESQCSWVVMNPEPKVENYGPVESPNHAFLSTTELDVDADAVLSSPNAAQQRERRSGLNEIDPVEPTYLFQ